MAKIKVGIVGGTGYTGVELLRLLSQHPDVELQAITSRGEAGMPVAQMFPSLRGRVALNFTAPDAARLADCDIVFFATPHGVAMAQAPALLAAGVKIIDLAADFRFRDLALFEQWYGMPHACPEIAAEAVYGIPELHRDRIRSARVVGNSGCYPVTVQLGFAPLLRRGWIDDAHLIANCVSGVSGAGRKAEVHTLYCEAGDNFKAYGVKGHRHGAEINEQLQRLTGKASTHCLFMPHLAPMIRGMHSTLYARLCGEGTSASIEQLQAVYEDAYRGEPFVDVLPPGSAPDTRSTRASNAIRIALHRPQPDTVMLLVVQDNLVKGASGQAVQCMNLMCGLPEDTGLTAVPVLP
jgi:N-acetyl-gamma-glutamyl-phosphate reductase